MYKLSIYSRPDSNIFGGLQRNINELFDDFMSGFDISSTSRNTSSWTKMDTKETKGEYTVCIKLPRVNEKDIKINVVSNNLNIAAERKQEEKDESESCVCREIFYGTMKRSLALPEDADSDNTKAQYKDGMLKIIIPKLKISDKVEEISIGS
jgi:HSP20 family protein